MPKYYNTCDSITILCYWNPPCHTSRHCPTYIPSPKYIQFLLTIHSEGFEHAAEAESVVRHTKKKNFDIYFNSL